MNLEDIMLSKINQTQKDEHCMISLMCGSKKPKLIETESEMVVARGWGVGKMERC